MDKIRTTPKKIFRHRGYVGGDLNVSEKKSRLQSELEAAKDGKVWFSSLVEQNDPFDTNPTLVWSSKAEMSRAIRAYHRERGSYTGLSGNDMREDPRAKDIPASQIRKLLSDPEFFLRRLNELMPEYRQEHLIACFTEVPTNILMWAYYSSSHQSFCLEFSREERAQSEAAGILGKVKYLEARPRISSVEVFRWLVNGGSENSFVSTVLQVGPEESVRVTDAVLLAKAKEWQHE